MKINHTLFGLLWIGISSAQSLQSPSAFLGYELGARFSRHHQVMEYYEYVAKNAPAMVKLQPYGETYEHRPLLVAFISSPENIANLETIRQEQLKATQGEGSAKIAIVWLSYNVHGNESVSTEASMQTLYDLITQKQEWLKNTLVVIDPCINPDGRDRYVNWYNQFVNTPYQVDPNSKEHHESWLSGRSNHYMFDLNRDWAWITQVESQQRLKLYNQWLPHVHVDFHEQGVNEPYYFAPAAEPLHEVITDWQREFQVTIGKNNARYFDAEGWFYFTKEIFDLLYPSYGDTYPTYTGAIGMTYEQGGSGVAGLGILTEYGDTLTLKDRIAHHYTTGISTVEMTSKHAERLIAEYKKFYARTNYRYKSYVMSGDPDKIEALKALLDAHEIKYGYSDKVNVKGYEYTTRKEKTLKSDVPHLIVSTNQRKSALVSALFEPVAKLSDSATYDITAWSLPYAYGLEALASENLVNATPLPPVETRSSELLQPNAYAYLADWSSMKDARFLAELLKENIRVRYTERPFTLAGKTFGSGSLIITKGDNKNNRNWVERLATVAQKHGKSLISAATGYVDAGRDFGSESVKMISPVRVAALAGEPVSTLNVGEIWHFFEQQLQYPLTVLDTDYINSVNLNTYQVLILPEGWYKNNWDEKRLQVLKDWVRNGGKLIAIGDALTFLEGDADLGLKGKKAASAETEKNKNTASYSATERNYIKNIITGAIFKAKVDATHPLAFGYGNDYFTLKLSPAAYELLPSGNVAYIGAESDPYSGFAGSEAKKQLPSSLLFGVSPLGRGCVVYMVDNPLFRGFWENGKLFFANAIFMVNNP